MTELVTVDQPGVAEIGARLRAAGALGDTYADFAPLFQDVADEEAAYDQLETIGRFVAASFDASRWWAADYLIFGEGLIGQRFYQLSEVLGLSESTLVDYARVAMRVARSRRRGDLHFSHHRIVAKLSPEEQSYWLDRAATADLSTRELDEEVRRATTGDEGGDETGDGGASSDVVDTVRVARALLVSILNHARPAPDDPGYVLIPEEAVARVRAVVGEEER